MNSTDNDCRIEFSTLGLSTGNNTASSLAASIVGIVILFITVVYIW